MTKQALKILQKVAVGEILLFLLENGVSQSSDVFKTANLTSVNFQLKAIRRMGWIKKIMDEDSINIFYELTEAGKEIAVSLRRLLEVIAKHSQ